MNKNLFYIALIALAVVVFIAQHIRRKTRPFYQALDKKYQDLLAGRFQDPKQARRFKNALAAYETRQYSSALKQLGKLLQSAQDPQDQALCHFIMGCCDDEQQQYAAAQRAYEEAARLDPGLLAAQSNLATLLDITGQPEKSADMLRFLVEKWPKDARVHMNYAAALTHLHRDTQAVQEFKTALELDGTMLDARISLSVLYARMGQIKQSQEWVQDAVFHGADEVRLRGMIESELKKRK